MDRRRSCIAVDDGGAAVNNLTVVVGRRPSAMLSFTRACTYYNILLYRCTERGDRCIYSTTYIHCLGRRCRALLNLPFDRITRGRISRGHVRNLNNFIIIYKYIYSNVCIMHLDTMPKYVKSPFPVSTAWTNLSHLRLRRRLRPRRFLNRKHAEIYTHNELRPTRCRAKYTYTTLTHAHAHTQFCNLVEFILVLSIAIISICKLNEFCVYNSMFNRNLERNTFNYYYNFYVKVDIFKRFYQDSYEKK